MPAGCCCGPMAQGAGEHPAGATRPTARSLRPQTLRYLWPAGCRLFSFSGCASFAGTGAASAGWLGCRLGRFGAGWAGSVPGQSGRFRLIRKRCMPYRGRTLIA